MRSPMRSDLDTSKIPGPDGKLTQFAHASSIQIVTPAGKLAQYYMGVEYSPKDLRLGLVEASSNASGRRSITS